MLSTFRFEAMGGTNEILIYSLDRDLPRLAANAAIAEVRRIESKFSRFSLSSVLSQINSSAATGAFKVDEETAGLLDYASACFHQSEGLFDITSGVLRRAWNFQDCRLPEPSVINRLLPLIGWDRVKWKRPFLELPIEGMELDFGGIGKEYAADRAAGILCRFGLEQSLVNLSGDIRVCGPRENGLPWSVAIAEPSDAGGLFDSLLIAQGGLATSGDYVRRIEINGRRFSHILNPKTGWPVEGLQSVTALAESCLLAGTLTTTAMLKGTAGIAYLRSLGVSFIAVSTSGEVFRSIQLDGSSVNHRRGSSGECAFSNATKKHKKLPLMRTST